MAKEQTETMEVSRQEFDTLAQQLAEMQGQLATAHEQNAALEQAMNNLIDGMQAEKDAAGREDFYDEFEYEFGGRHDYSDRAWQMYEDSGKSVDRREFVSHLVSQMDDEMRDYLAAKGMKVVFESGESAPPEVSGEGALPAEGPPVEAVETGLAEEALEENGDAVEELVPEESQELSSKDKINRLLTQNDNKN